MDMAKVIGSIVSTKKHPSLVGTKICVIQPINHDGQEVGKALIAIDPDSRVGYGETVYFVTGGDATTLDETRPMPIEAAIVGIVDSYHACNEHIKEVGTLRKYKKY